MKKTGLGRGLGSLLPDNDEMLQSVVQEISLGDIDPNREQPRRSFKEESLNQLAQSIQESGILQPLIVVSTGNRYRIVAGERRYRAARLIGLSTVPCIVRQMDQIQQMAAALVENLQREDLNPMESAAAIRALMQQCGYTQEAAAQKLGKSRPAIANLLRLLSLPDEVANLIRQGLLSQGHAKVLAGLSNEKKQIEWAKKAVQDGLNVRQLEKMSAKAENPPAAKKEKARLAPELKEMEGKLTEAFGVKAVLSGSRKKGKIVLPYATAQELDRIYDAIEKLKD
jgi:ParB-like partition proteins